MRRYYERPGKKRKPPPTPAEIDLAILQTIAEDGPFADLGNRALRALPRLRRDGYLERAGPDCHALTAKGRALLELSRKASQKEPRSPNGDD